MLWLVATGAAVAVAAAAVARRRSVRRFQALKRDLSARALRPDGIIDGAEPLALNAAGDRCALILHGFNDTPQSVRALAVALHARGWSVRVPLLPRHGRSFEELAVRGSAPEWIAHAREEWRAVRAQCSHAALIGQSMGGAIAVMLAAESPPAALVLLAPYLRMGALARALSYVWPLWALVTPRLFANAQRGFRDAAARARSLGHGAFTPRLVRELRRVVDDAKPAAPAVKAPALVVHSRRDYRIASSAATWAYARLGSADKELVWRDGAGHVLTADAGKEEVFALVGDWLDGHDSGAGD
jgi:carboxylesterase